MELTSANVHDIFMKCLYTKGEKTDGHIKGEGVQLVAGFHPGRLSENHENISSMLNDLPEPFYKDSGAGMSFLNFVVNKSGEQWTGDHAIADELLMLGNAIGEIKFLMPRENWNALPGGMPYLVIIKN